MEADNLLVSHNVLVGRHVGHEFGEAHQDGLSSLLTLDLGNLGLLSQLGGHGHVEGVVVLLVEYKRSNLRSDSTKDNGLSSRKGLCQLVGGHLTQVHDLVFNLEFEGGLSDELHTGDQVGDLLLALLVLRVDEGVELLQEAVAQDVLSNLTVSHPLEDGDEHAAGELTDLLVIVHQEGHGDVDQSVLDLDEEAVTGGSGHVLDHLGDSSSLVQVSCLLQVRLEDVERLVDDSLAELLDESTHARQAHDLELVVR
mmetsp:Transcript_34907/g.53572  ORF Transcript_34907/g.53572 Transcript_34907/m.53572 type:complete len:254 (+) Transcript_34907:1754-2515(+)